MALSFVIGSALDYLLFFHSLKPPYILIIIFQFLSTREGSDSKFPVQDHVIHQ